MRRAPFEAGAKGEEVEEEDAIRKSPSPPSSPTEGRGRFLRDYFLGNYRGEVTFGFL